MTQLHENIVGLDSGILMHPKVWEASGHIGAFNDPLVDCKKCKARYRADELFDGDLNDKSGNKRNASGHNSPGFSEGKLGKALKLNGDNQYITLGGKPADYAPKSGSITISFWFSAIS